MVIWSFKHLSSIGINSFADQFTKNPIKTHHTIHTKRKVSDRLLLSEQCGYIQELSRCLEFHSFLQFKNTTYRSRTTSLLRNPIVNVYQSLENE